MTDDIKVWTQPLDLAEPEVERFHQILSSDERERAARFHLPIHRARFAVARGRLREIVAACTGSRPEQVIFAYNRYGKPVVSGLEVNVSHSDALAAYAVSLTRQVGIDIERVRAMSTTTIPEAFFAKTEVASLRALPQDLQLQAFYRIWTRKEAYIKALGKGLSIPLDSFDGLLDMPSPGWTIQSFAPDSGFAGAVAAEGDGWTLVRQPSGDRS